MKSILSVSRAALITVLALLSGFVPAKEKSPQTLFLKDGTILEGFISRQRPGQNLTFVTDRADVYLPSSGTQIIERMVKLSSLSEDWQEWAEANHVAEGVGEGRTLAMQDLMKADGSIIKDVRVLERGAHIRYLKLTPDSFTVSWDTIRMVRMAPRSRTALTGIDRKYTLNNGLEVEGQYVEEVPGKTLSLLKNGFVEVFDTEKVVRYFNRPINASQSIFEQSDLVDEVCLENGRIVQGIIVEFNYTSDNPDHNYVIMQKEDESAESFRMKDIVEYRKFRNPAYRPLYDVLLNPGDVLISRQEVDTTNIQSVGSSLFLDNDNCALIVPLENGKAVVNVEYRLSVGMDIKIVPLRSEKVKKETRFGFTYKDLVNPIAPISIETSVNHTTKAVYELPKPAKYVAYDAATQRAWIFQVK